MALILGTNNSNVNIVLGTIVTAVRGDNMVQGGQTIAAGEGSLLQRWPVGEKGKCMAKLNRIKWAARTSILVVSLWFCCCAYGGLSLRNYSDDANMAKAMEYDLGVYPCDYNTADRAKAERYYLEYLKDVNESFQKARVYAHIGASYAVGFDIRKGEKADYNKARYYFRKVLELEPERIDFVTIQGRTMLASMHESTAERVKARMDVYEWLRTIDAQKIRRLWLPLSPTDEAPSDLVMCATTDLVEHLHSTLETNILTGIMALPEEEAKEYLAEISRRFGGSELDKLARKKVQEEGISIPEQPAPRVVQPEVEERVAEQEHHQEASSWLWAWWLAGIGLLIVAIAAFARTLLLRKKASANAK